MKSLTPKTDDDTLHDLSIKDVVNLTPEKLALKQGMHLMSRQQHDAGRSPLPPLISYTLVTGMLYTGVTIYPHFPHVFVSH